jgi:hypothetical protein
MEASDIKPIVMAYLLHDRKCIMTMIEREVSCQPSLYGAIADVYALTKDFYGIEVEIKTSIMDLKSELDIISAIKTKSKIKNASLTKYSKHDAYLNDQQEKYSVNKYYFAVTTELEPYALFRLKGTPYGLLVIDGSGILSCSKSASYFSKKQQPAESIAKHCRTLSLRLSDALSQQVRVIDSEELYTRYLTEAEYLVSLDPNQGTKNGRRLDLLVTLIMKWESENYSFSTSNTDGS